MQHTHVSTVNRERCIHASTAYDDDPTNRQHTHVSAVNSQR
jgi:hypothetical protein